MASPGLDDRLRLGARAESFEAQAFVAVPAVETLCNALPLRHARLDQGGADALPDDPRQQRFRRELGAIGAARERRHAALPDEPRRHLDHPRRPETAVQSIAKPCSVRSSGTARHSSCRPLGLRSNTMSWDDTRFGPVGVCGRGRLAATRRLGRRRGTCKPACHSRRQRPTPIRYRSRHRKMPTRRRPERGYCPESSAFRATAGASRRTSGLRRSAPTATSISMQGRRVASPRYRPYAACRRRTGRLINSLQRPL